jgi:hypothetical protein
MFFHSPQTRSRQVHEVGASERVKYLFQDSCYNDSHAFVGWVALFNPTDPNANTFYGIATLSFLG